MSDELILDVSFDNQTVTDATENWTLSGTPNVTYEQISGGSGYSLVTGKLGTPPTLVAVDQEAIYNEYTIDFNLYVKPSYTDAGWFSFFNLNTGMNYSGDYRAKVSNGLTISITAGGSSPEVTIDSPTGRWIRITIISEYDSDTGAYTAYLYVDSVLRTYKQGTRLNGSPFAIGEKLVLFNRGGSSFFLPNTPGLAIDNLTVIAGIHVPNQTPAISLPNLSRVFQNFCTWISSQLSAVAKSGSYNDLSDKPTISTVNNGALTIQKNGTNVATFTANQSTAATANITVPTAVSELTNDSGYLTSSSNLDASKLTSGTVDIARLPQGALERLIKVANEAARYALTTADVQLGDTVQQLDTGIMYIVTDADHLDSAAGYTEYTAGTAASVPWSGVTGKPTFAAVATSGAYSDLTGTPTIPTVNNATLTIQRNGATVKTFTANASANVTADITVPTKTSDLTNDSNFVPSTDLATVATSGSYADLSNKPSIPVIDSALSSTSTNGLQNKVIKNALDGKADSSHTHSASDITSGLATVATSGSYNDLSNKPTIPTVNNATLTIQKNGTTVKTFTANASSNVTANITVPTKVSELDNDSNYLTSVPNLDASKITSGTIDIARLPAGALERLVTVTNQTARFALTTSSVQLGDVVKQTDTGMMYMVVDESKLNSSAGYEEFTAGSATSVPWSGVTGKPSSYTPSSHTHGNITNAGAVGTTANKPLITTTNGKITTGNFGTTANTFCQGNDSRLSDARTPTAHTHSASDITSGLATVATSGSYNDLSNKPTIPTVNNATLTIQKNGTTIDTFTANSSTDKTVNISVPTNTSELTNGAGFITADYAVPRSGGAVLTGNLCRTDNTGNLDVCGGIDYHGGATIALRAKDSISTGEEGYMHLHVEDLSDTRTMKLMPNGTWTWEGQAVQLISDQRLKQQIAEIDDKLLDAWEDVNLVQFKYNDAVDTKKDKARLHTGYVVQQIDTACKSHDVDISAYGLYCHEEYPEETEEVEVEQADGTKTKERKVIREASEHYSLRYTEVYAVECMYLRRCIARLTARIEELEKDKEQEAGK